MAPILAFSADHWGYVDANKETNTKSYLMQLEKPLWTYKPDYNPFGPDLTEELRARYERDFGFTTAEIALGQNEYFQQHLQTTGRRAEAEAYRLRQREFADYSLTRYSERLLDDYLRESPRFSPVYAVKQSVTTISVRPVPKVEFKANYNLSGNFADLKWVHPSYRAELTVDFIRGEIGPTEGQEYTLRLYRSFYKWSIDAYHKFYIRSTDVVFSFQLASSLRMQWQTNFLLAEEDVGNQERRTYLGFDYVF